MFLQKFVASVIQKFPGKKYFGPYRFLPVFFCLGAVLEFSMVNWTVGETNFYRVYKRRHVREQALAELEIEEQQKK